MEQDLLPLIVTSETAPTTTVTTVTSNCAPTLSYVPSNLSENHAISIKLPQFWPETPEVWFITAEAQFSLHRISSESRKYTHLLTALPPDIIQGNIDLIQNPSDPHNLYSNFKKELLQRLIPNEEQRIMELLYQTQMGDRKPSVFYRYLLQLVGRSTEIGNKIIRKIFLDRIPKPIQRTLIATESLPIEEQLSIADKLWEADKPTQFNISPVSSESFNSPDIKDSGNISLVSSEINLLREEVKQIMKDFFENFLANNNRNNNDTNFKQENLRGRQKHNKYVYKRSKSKGRDSSQKASSENILCWYHNKYGDNAIKCIKPCHFFKSSEEQEN